MKVLKYAIMDNQTGQRVGVYVSRKTARARADVLDADYGAYRYFVVPMEYDDVTKTYVRVGLSRQS